MAEGDPSPAPASGTVLERIDPARQRGHLALDHQARYAFAAPFAAGKRVLDAACGVGFGSFALAEAGAKAVVGLDVAPEALTIARENYPHERVTYDVADLEADSLDPWGVFDLIVSFETLEHLRDPGALVASFAARLGPGGLLLVSVPGEGDAEVANPFHLQHFTREGVEVMLRRHFAHVRLLKQEFALVSRITLEGGGAPILQSGEPKRAALPPPHTWLALASRDPLPEIAEVALSSVLLWEEEWRERLHLHAYAERLEGKFHELAEKFYRSVAFGRYYKRALENLPDRAAAHQALLEELRNGPNPGGKPGA